MGKSPGPENRYVQFRSRKKGSKKMNGKASEKIGKELSIETLKNVVGGQLPLSPAHRRLHEHVRNHH
jgi:hypothetical protein